MDKLPSGIVPAGSGQDPAAGGAGACPAFHGIPDPSDPAVRALDALADLGVAWKQFFHRIHTEPPEGAGTRLAPQEYLVLGRIRDSGSASPSDLSRALGIARPNMTALLRGLEGRGYLSCVPDARDGRSRRYTLTPQGTDCLAGLHEERARRMRGIMAALDPHEVEELDSLSRRLSSLIRRLEAPEL